MGCASSTQYVMDPATGQEKKKTKMGGAYPGQRRPQHAPYSPPDSQFQNGQATAHFVAYGGGNALVLQQTNGASAPQTGSSNANQFIQVTLPPGVQAGQTIHVQAPDGRVNAIVIPSGMGPGSTFTVEFAPDAQAPPPSSTQSYSGGPTQPTAAAPNRVDHPDDGFATGFNNPNWSPPAQSTSVQASAPYEATPLAEQEIDLASYPTATATPVNSSTNNYGAYKP